MNQVLARTTETIKNAVPEVGNLVGAFGLTYPGAAYGIIAEVVEVDGAHLVNVTWFAPKTTRKRAHQEAQRSNAARRVAVCDRLDAINKHYQEA